MKIKTKKKINRGHTGSSFAVGKKGRKLKIKRNLLRR